MSYLENPKKMEGLVSIIIPVYNRGAMLHEAVQSVVDQTYRPIEVVIVDDGSTDDTSDTIHQLCSEYGALIKTIRKENGGPGLARQAGMELAAGEFIQFLDSDDLLLTQKFELQVAGLRKHPDCDVSYGKTRAYMIGEEKKDIPSRSTGIKFDHLFPLCLEERPWNTVTPLYRRKMLDEIGPVSGLRQFEDWEYDCRIAKRDVRLHYVDEFICEQRHHKGERAGHGWKTNDQSLRDAAEALARIFSHAKSANIDLTSREMQSFLNYLLYWGRECAYRGLYSDAARLTEMAGQVIQDKKRKTVLRIYRILSVIFGWRNTERLVRWIKGHSA